jgi:predicted nucleic acid-binding protein
MVIVDTTVWIDYFAGIANSQTMWLRRAAGVTSLALTDLILCEVLQGVRHDSDLPRIKNRLMGWEIIDSGGTGLALAAAGNYRLLRAKGYTVRTTIDLLIATVCIQSDHALLHHDRDFEPFERHLGLQVVHP